MNVEECSPLSNLIGTGTTMKLVVKMNTIKWSDGHEVGCKDEYHQVAVSDLTTLA